jgi:hypothetical protein
MRCEPMPFAAEIAVPEASGSLVTTLDGRDVVLVVGDSGHAGAFEYIDATTGEHVAGGALPLGDGASDDLEGLAAQGDDIVAITSSGWMRRWKRDGSAFALVDGPYPIGDVDETLASSPMFEPPPVTDAFACKGDLVNCGKNYEALCLAYPPETGTACAGWAGSKSDGVLWCLVEESGRLRADRSRSIAVTARGLLAGCDVDEHGAIWVATNGFDGGVYVVRDGKVTESPIEPGGFPETIAVGRGGAIYRFHDTGGAPSAAERFRCQ